MAFSIVNSYRNINPGNSFALGWTPTVGNWLLVVMGNNSFDAGDADTGWTRWLNSPDGSSYNAIGVYYRQVQIGDTGTIQPVTAASLVGPYGVAVYELSGLGAGLPAAFSATYSDTNPSAAIGEPASPVEMFNFGSWRNGSGLTASGATWDGNFTVTASGRQIRDTYVAIAAASTVTTTWTGDSGDQFHSLAFAIKTVDDGLTVGVGTLTYTGGALPIATVIDVEVGALEYTGYAVTLAARLVVQAGRDTLVYTGEPVSVAGRRTAEPGKDDLIYTGHEAHVNQLVAPAHASLIYTGQLAHIIKVDVSQAGAAYVFDSFPPNASVSQAGDMVIYSVDANAGVSQAGAMVVYDIVGCATTWCQVWLIYRLDGEVLAFTSLDQDITFLGHVARHCDSLNPTATEEMADLDAVANYELSGIISDDGISESDLWAGIYDGAYVEAWLVDWAGTDTPRRLAAGTAGKVSQGDGFTMEVLGMGGKLQQQAITPVATAKCKYKGLGLDGCPVNVAAITLTATVTGVTNRRVIRAAALAVAPPHPFTGGKVTCLTGANEGFQSEIKSFDQATGEFTLWVPAPFPWAIGDTATFAPGCDLLVATCKSYGVYTSFGGYPDVPGDDAINETPIAVYDT